MKFFIILFIFAGFCLSLNYAAKRAVHPKLTRASQPDDLTEAEAFWRTWLGPALPPSPSLDPTADELSSNKTLSPVGITIMNNSTSSFSQEINDLTPVTPNADISASALLQTPEEKRIFIAKLFAALSNEIGNATVESPLAGLKPNVTESAVKTVASKLSPTDRALFENLVILSLVRPTGHSGAPSGTTVNNEESMNNLVTLHPDVTLISNDEQGLTNETQRDNETWSSPEVNESVPISVTTEKVEMTTGTSSSVMNPKLLALLIKAAKLFSTTSPMKSGKVTTEMAPTDPSKTGTQLENTKVEMLKKLVVSLLLSRNLTVSTPTPDPIKFVM